MKYYGMGCEVTLVLTTKVVRPGGFRYYVGSRDLAQGPEGIGSDLEGPGLWSGAGAASLGLQETVMPGPFATLLHGVDPGSEAVLRADRGSASVAGFDLTFCAPKSVSLLAALAPREVATEAGRGHDAAVADASGYLSRNGLGVRRVQRGATSYLPSTGLVAAEFRHLTSRALDPHLHTHVVAANVAQGVDGRWSAVDGRRVFAHLRAAGAVYQASLRSELGARIGAGWEVRPSGLGDVAGVDPGLRRLFSQRTAEIEQYVAERFGNDGRRHRGAFYATRPDKDLSQTVDQLTDGWRRRAADFGFDLGELSRAVGRGRTAELAGGRLGGNAVLSGGFDPERMAARLVEAGRPERTLSRGDLVAQVAAATTAGAGSRHLEEVADGILAVSGAPVAGINGPEPRWPVDVVVRSLGEGRQVSTVERSDGVHGGGDGQGRSTRERGAERSTGTRAPGERADPLDRVARFANERRRRLERDRTPDRQRGIDLGR